MDTPHFIIIAAVFLTICATAYPQDNIWDEPVPEASTPDPAPPQPSYTEATEPSPQVSEQDATYVIKKGDTLWDLAFQFLGNPFDWQKIWQVNPYITNPDLIYPGNTLTIPGRMSASAMSSTGGLSRGLIPSETFGAIDFKAAEGAMTQLGGYPGDTEFLISLRKKNLLTAAQLASAPYLWTEKNKTGQVSPGDGIVAAPKQGASYQLYSRISVTIGTKATYAVGDTIDIFKSHRYVMYQNKLSNLVQRTGRAVVKEVMLKKMDALLFSMNDAISGDEQVTPVKRFETLTLDTLVTSGAGITAKVFTRVEQTASVYPFQMIILDKGSTHGVLVGDVFAVYTRKFNQLSVIGIITHANENSSTLNMVYMRKNQVEEGDEAKLIRRAQFTERAAADDGQNPDARTTTSDQ